ncbi:hypothetical protein ACOSQ3_009186 [Xanthoceras sorbifolium]
METFIDYQLRRGDEISPSFLKAIEESQISIIVFSRGYTSSKWCLEELVKILQCKSTYGQIVVPVFYKMDLSDVRNQTGSFADAFAEHEQHSKDSINRVQTWKDALKEAANLSGLDSRVIKPESELIENIVQDVLKRLNVMSQKNNNDLIGIDSMINEIESLLYIGSNDDVRSVAICGIGGIGKTTLAAAVFDRISCQFEGFCFIHGVREESEQSGGLNRLRRELYYAILGDLNIFNSFVGCNFMKKRLGHDNKNENKVHVSKGLDSVFNELRMQDSNVELLWNGVLQLVNFKEIHLSGSENLISCPDESGARNLDVLYLDGCTNCFASLKSLKKLNMYGCSHVKMLPEMSCNIEYLNLSETAIEELSPAIDNLSKLVELSLQRCSRLKSLSTSICKPKSLERLFLYHCSKIDTLPDEIGALESLIMLRIAGTIIRELPSSIIHLNNLEMLSFKRCKVQDRMMNLLLLPSLGLCSLKKLDLTDCGIAKIPNSLTHLSQLRRLHLGSNKFESIPTNVENLFNLKYLDISYCQRLQFLPKLPSTSINAVNCISLEVSQFLSVPYTITCASKFYVAFANCFKLYRNGLKDIVEDVLQKIQSLATLWTKQPYVKLFSFRSSGSLIIEELPPGWNNNKFVGFALCAVMETQHHRIVNSWDLYICCECNLKSKDGHWHVFTGKFGYQPYDYCAEPYHVVSDHVYMGADHLMYPRDTDELCYDVEVTFQFYIETGLRHVECCKVKSYGVCLMYAQDLGKSSASFSFVASICFPRSEILEWFSFRNSGSLITEELPPGWNNNKFVGFALCAVMETQHHRIVNSWDLYICCECNVKSKDGHWHVFTGKFSYQPYDYSAEPHYVVPDHVYMGADNLMYPRDAGELCYDIEVTFQFYIETGLRHVECCKCLSVQDRIVAIGSPFIKIDLINCFQLDRNVLIEEALLKLQSLAILWKENYYNKDLHAPPLSIVICFPGSEVPEQFSFRNLGSFITVKLPPDWLNVTLLVSLCVMWWHFETMKIVVCFWILTMNVNSNLKMGSVMLHMALWVIGTSLNLMDNAIKSGQILCT